MENEPSSQKIIVEQWYVEYWRQLRHSRLAALWFPVALARLPKEKVTAERQSNSRNHMKWFLHEPVVIQLW